MLFAVKSLVTGKDVASMSRKGENIYKRKDGRWEARFIKRRSANGKAEYGYVYAKSYREVKQKLYESILLLELTLNEPHSVAVPNFGDIANGWLISTLPRVKESTANKYRNLLTSYIMPYLSSFPLSELSPSCIETVCNNLLHSGGKQQTGLSPKTVSDALSVIRNILRYAAANGHTVCDIQSVQIKHDFRPMRVLSRKEQEKLCSYLYAHLNSFNIGILICLFTGIRVGELCALKWEDISLKENTIYIHQTMQRVQAQNTGPKKTKIIITTPKSICSIRTIPIPAELAEIILKYQTTNVGFFLTNSNQHYVEPRTMQNRFKEVLKENSINEANFHALRHTFATRCVEVGFDVKSLSEILGHASVNITMNRYVHPSLELKKQNMQRLSDLFAVK